MPKAFLHTPQNLQLISNYLPLGIIYMGKKLLSYFEEKKLKTAIKKRMKVKGKKVLPYAFPISLMLEIEQTNTMANTSRNQLMTGI